MKTKYNTELLLYPCPVVLVTSKYENIENVLTVAWTGIASSHPEFVTISVNSKRYSHNIIRSSKHFCINIPDSNLIEIVDFCGSYSGRDIDKFKVCGLTKQYVNDYILIDECPFSVICTVRAEYSLGSHTLFVAEVENKYYDSHSSAVIHGSLDPIAYFRPYYYRLEKKPMGEYGFTKFKRLKLN